MFSAFCGVVSVLAMLPLLADVQVPSHSGGANKATFDKIKADMTPQECETLMGRRADCTFAAGHYSQMQFWDGKHTRIYVEYEPTIANGKVRRASFYDYSTNRWIQLRRLPTEHESKTVIGDLIADAQTKMPLNDSDAFTKQIPVTNTEATNYINDRPDYTAYHLLVALRATNLAAYRGIPAAARASVLCSTLKEQMYFDDWTPPDFITTDEPTNIGEPEKALLECGMPAIAFLLPLLDDHSPAGDSEYEEERDFEYRRADYAFRYISLILKLSYSFQPEPEGRDKDISALKKKLYDAINVEGQPNSGVTKANASRIHVGMTLDDVETILGGPSDRICSRNAGTQFLRTWYGAEGTLRVLFFESGIRTCIPNGVESVTFRPSCTRSPPLADKVPAWLGW